MQWKNALMQSEQDMLSFRSCSLGIVKTVLSESRELAWNQQKSLRGPTWSFTAVAPRQRDNTETML